VGVVIPLLVTFTLLLGGMGLFVAARERQRRSRMKKLRAARGQVPLAALPPGDVDGDLATALGEVHELRLVLEAALQHGEQVELLDRQLTHAARELMRRPLWLRVEDSSYAYDLDAAQSAAEQWLAHLAGLDAHTRGRLAKLGLDTADVKRLAEARHDTAEHDPAARDALERDVERALQTLKKFERELSSQHSSFYR